jgi:hypothetical protein
MEMKAKKVFIERQLESLKMQTSVHKKPPEEEDASGLILSRAEHKSLVQRIKKERQEREKKHEELLLAMQ